jgi:flagella synthesis protein FlgN
MTQPLQAELDAALAAVIEELRATTGQFAACLGEEREALLNADAEALNRAGEAKQALMRRLEQLDAERLQLGAAAPQAMRDLQPAWNDILKTLESCRRLNLRNGNLVGQRLAQVRRALAILTGSDDSGLYGRSGELQNARRSVSLAQA